ncbi:hypothetical protein [Candidatus Poriferisodalis sp.]|uniref:hypothetical protein n=1 Tax=Candidatus Poriferisodalis sp. TaxID=3101277 RepID=UPI003B01080B
MAVAVLSLATAGCGGATATEATASTQLVQNTPGTQPLQSHDQESQDQDTLVSDGLPTSTTSTEATEESAAIQRQIEALQDERVSDDEYVAAYEAFVSCSRGLGADVIERGRDARTGLIRYGYSDEHADIVRKCNSWHFARIDAWVQTRDPDVHEERRAESVRWFEEDVVPCLERFGIEVPDHLTGEQEDPEEREYWTQYSDYVMTGDCE